MVQTLLDRGYLRTPPVIEAMRAVPRDAFLPPEARAKAHEDRPVWIGRDQTMSAPHMVALMCEALELAPAQRILEIGTGSGYHAAVTARIVGADGAVDSIEFDAVLCDDARRNLAAVGVQNVRVHAGDGSRGRPEGAPYDRIYLTCSAPRIPKPLLDQVTPGGLILAPLGPTPSRLVRTRRDGDAWHEEDLGACAFVPLRGEFGFGDR